MRGEALVIVLLFLVLISGLMLSFYSGITSETASTTVWKNAVTTRELADSAVYLDIAQIRDATAGFVHNADGSLDLTTPAGWASQPGAIRVFSTNFPGTGAILYKLYTAPSLVDLTGNGNPTNDLPPTGWYNKTALYVDLNAPVWSGAAGTNVYPIMDPSLAMTNPSTSLANGAPYVDGFTINANSPTLLGSTNTAAMPVSWLYVLRDGTLIAPDPSGATTATFTGASTQPTSNNPIVGRIAFWTDDETCKLNINTASEGAPWNVPSLQSLEDLHAQNSPPAGNEFNRFLGHPASVSLSPILWGYFGFPHPASLIWASPGSSGTATNLEWGYYTPVMPAILSNGLTTSSTNYANALFGQSNLVEGILPRIGWATNGSVFGSVNLLVSNRTAFLQQQTLKSDRFYSSMDEMFFSAVGGRAANCDLLMPQTVDRLRFFLTAESRAPEVNVFNLPRICLWPLNDTNAARANTVNPFLAALSGTDRWSLPDKLIARCSTLGTNPYYFTRFDPTSQTADFQGRNVTLHGYLANLLQTPVPGFSGGSFQTRWGVPGCNEEATLIYDYIRGCINLVDSYGNTNGPGGTDATAPAQRYAYSYTIPPTNTVSNSSKVDLIVPGSGQVVPITITANGVTTRGQGRFPVLKSATLVFCAVAADQPPLMIDPVTRIPQSPAAANPLHPFPTTITNSIVITNANYEGANPFIPIISTNQFPSYYPTNLVSFSSYPTNATNNNVIGTNLWVTNIANISTSSVAPVATNIAMANVFIRASNSSYGNCALTVTHPGLVYGGDLDPFTRAFDGVNLFFGSNASLLGIATSIPTTYVNGWATNQNPVTLLYAETNYTVSANLTLADTSSSLFPKPYQTVMQPVLILNHGLTTPGFAPYGPAFKIRVTGLGSLQADGQALYAGGSSGKYGQLITNIPPAGWGGSSFGPDLGVAYALLSNSVNNMTNGVTNANAWPFVGNFVKATNAASPNYGRTFAFSGGTITIEYLKPTASYATVSSNDVLQTLRITFPSATFPTPKLPPFNGVQASNTVCFYSPSGNNATYTGTVSTNYPPNFINPKFLYPVNSLGTNRNYATYLNTTYNMGWFFMPELYAQGGTVPVQGYGTANTLRSVEVTYGDWRLPAMMQTADAGGNPPLNGGNYGYTLATATNLYSPHMLYYAGSNEPATSALGTNFFWRSAHTLRDQIGFYAYADAGHPFLCWGMYVQGLSDASNGAYNGEPGLIYNGAYAGPSGTDTPRRMIAHLSHRGSWSDYPDALSTADFGGHLTAPPGADFLSVWRMGGDFDTAPGGAVMDGPYINKADEGSAGWVDNSTYGFGVGAPYNGWDPAWGSVGRSRFGPNRQVPSAGILGSLPAGFNPSNPLITNAWRSLVFCPNPNSSNRVASMPDPPDYMIMDLFNMPVIQPYPISDPFSTAGRVNINYQIAPFSYIKRDSALRGLLKSVDMTAISDNAAGNYKFYANTRTIPNAPPNAPTNSYYYRYPVHLDQTLRQFDFKFSTNGFFRSGAEICTMWLYPALAPNGASSSYATNPAVPLVTDAPGSSANIFKWWYANPGTTRKGITGANMRARPYAGIYGNITAKSNTYQIHYRVQTLKQTPSAHASGNYAAWIDPASGGFTDKVLGEQRGSAVIERYIDPGNSALPDFAGQIATNGANALTNPANIVDSYYQYRVINSKTFAP
jgi:uncharacterized protein (TIGR02600 family)